MKRKAVTIPPDTSSNIDEIRYASSSIIESSWIVIILRMFFFAEAEQAEARTAWPRESKAYLVCNQPGKKVYGSISMLLL